MESDTRRPPAPAITAARATATTMSQNPDAPEEPGGSLRCSRVRANQMEPSAIRKSLLRMESFTPDPPASRGCALSRAAARPLGRPSPESARDVVFGLACLGPGEDGGGLPDLDQSAHVEKCRALRDARGLLHVVGHDDDGEHVAEIGDEVFDLGG